jgi:hypothetical protein
MREAAERFTKVSIAFLVCKRRVSCEPSRIYHRPMVDPWSSPELIRRSTLFGCKIASP